MEKGEKSILPTPSTSFIFHSKGTPSLSESECNSSDIHPPAHVHTSSRLGRGWTWSEKGPGKMTG